MAKRRALVTGGAGFIGSHVADLYEAQGYDVTVLDNLSSGRRENVPEGRKFEELDITSAEAGRVVRDGRFDVISHLAAQIDVRKSVVDPLADARINILGSLNLLEAVRAGGHPTRVVFSSTGGAIYGECDEPAPEDAATEPLSPYGTSKLAAEEYLRSYNRLHGTRHIALRYGNVYGPRQDPHGEAGVVAIFLGALLRGEQSRIFGDGAQTRDYVYVGDVARATLAALGHEGGVFNIGTGRETAVTELWRLCRRVSGSELEALHAPARAGEIARSVLDTAHAAADLGFAAFVELEKGLQATRDWLLAAQKE